MQSIAPVKRQSHFDTALHIYGVVRKQVEEIKISFVVARKDWKQFRSDVESYGTFLEFDHFMIDGAPIRSFGPIRGCVLARGSVDKNDELVAYLEAHPAFKPVEKRAHETGRGLNLIKQGAVASS